MRILAVDPGTTQSAYVRWDGRSVITHQILPNEALLKMLRNLEYVQFALEKIESFGMPVGREVLETVRWCGRFIEAVDVSGCQWADVTRREVKLHICGHARATDANIRQALIDRLGPIGTKKNQGPLYGLKGHEFAALAVAVTWYDQHSEEIRPGVTAQF